MTNSVSFDRAASYYDQTRPLPEQVAGPGIQAILDLVGPSAHILDVGTGTGRISVPLLDRGTNLVGCDISAKMLNRLQGKYTSARLAQADASHLPFPAGCFEAVLTVHVIHLMSPWQEAVNEFKRVLVPGGVYLNVRTYASTGNAVREQIRKYWRGWVEAHGAQIYQPGVQDFQEFLNELKSLGAHLEEVEVVRFTLPFTLREELERFNSRVYSDAWNIPDEIFSSSLEDLRVWVAREYGDLDQPREEQVRFVIDVARFDGVNEIGGR